MQVLSLIFIGLILTSCAGLGLDNSAFQLKTTEYDDTNSGVILFRTINTNTKNEVSGFAVAFKDKNSDLYIANKSGLSGYPDKTYHALRIPAGNYFLDNFFVYGGQMKPVDIPYSFSINTGETIYIGSLIKPWTLGEGQMPESLIDVTLKQYATRSLTGLGPAASLMVANEGDSAIYKFKSIYPSLEGKSIITRMLK